MSFCRNQARAWLIAEHGSVVLVTLVSSALIMLTISLVVGVAVSGRYAALVRATENGALNAVDTRTGRMAGLPCSNAATQVEAIGGVVERCTFDGFDVRIESILPWGFLTLRARAHAGIAP